MRKDSRVNESAQADKISQFRVGERGARVYTQGLIKMGNLSAGTGNHSPQPQC